MALVAAGASLAGSIAGGLITGGASYLTTQSNNHAIIQRDERNDDLAARSATRLVDTELAQVAVQLSVVQRQRGINASSLATALQRLPNAEWKANQRVLARTLSVGDWGLVSVVYELIDASATDKRVLAVPDFQIGVLQHQVTQARDALRGYE